MKRSLTVLYLAFIVLPFLSGCVASVISESVLMEVDRTITIPMVQSDPELYKDRRVLWGGVIVSTKNLTDSSRIEVLARELAFMDQPLRNSPVSQGRFLIMAPGYRDPLLFKPDTQITVAGTIKGVKSELIGEMSYPYVLIAPIEMKTFDADDDYNRYDDYPYLRDYPFYGPYGPYPPYLHDPFLDPYYGPYYPGLPPFFYPGGFGLTPRPGYYHHHD